MLLRLAGLSHRHRRAAEFDDELKSNLQMRIDDNLRAGMSPDEARYAALHKLGNVTRVKEETWELWNRRVSNFGLRIARAHPLYFVETSSGTATGFSPVICTKRALPQAGDSPRAALASMLAEGIPVRANDFSQSWEDGPRMLPSM